MVILRQKEFVSRKMRLKVGVETGKRNIKFLGKLGKLAGKRVKETGELMAIPSSNAVSTIARDVVKENKRTLHFMKDQAKRVVDSRTPLSKRLGVVAEFATDLNPKTAIGKHLAAEVYHTTGKTGQDVVRGLAEAATNPAKKVGAKLADFRQGGHGGKRLAGKWVGPGTNKWCLGLAPDTVVTSVGEQFENYKGKKALQQEVEALVKSKDGRRFARSYDKILGRRLNRVYEGVHEAISDVPRRIDSIGTAIGSVFRRPQAIPVAVQI